MLDAFYVVKLAIQVVDEVRRRAQQSTVGRRGHKDDPLYKVRGLLRHGREHLSPRQQARLEAGLQAGDPTWEVSLAWHCYQQLRSAYTTANPATGRKIAETVISSFPSCPIPEVARLGRTLRAWKPQLLAYFATHGVSNGGTEAVNLLIEKTRRLAPGFRNFTNYRSGSSSSPTPHAPTDNDQPTLKSEEPYSPAAGTSFAPEGGRAAGTTYAKMIVLKNSGSSNGTQLATFDQLVLENGVQV